MKFSIRALLRQPHDADRSSLSLFRDVQHDQAFTPWSKHCEVSTSKYDTRSPLPSLKKPKFGRTRRHATIDSEQELGSDAPLTKDNEPEQQRIWSKIVDEYSKAKANIVGSRTKGLFKKNEPHHQPSTSVIQTGRQITE